MSHWYTPSEPAGVVDGHVLLTPEAASDDWLAKVYDEDGYLLGGEAVQADGGFSVALLRTPVSPKLAVHLRSFGSDCTWVANAVLQEGRAFVTVLPPHDAPPQPQDPAPELVAESFSAPVIEPACVPELMSQLLLELLPEPVLAPELEPELLLEPEPEPEPELVAAYVPAPVLMPAPAPEPLPIDASPWVLTVRGQSVLLDTDLAHLYGVLPRRLGEQTKLHWHLFEPAEVFRLTSDEKAQCVATVARLNKLRHSVALPYAYTEAGALRLAQWLNTPLAKERLADVAQAFVTARFSSPPCLAPVGNTFDSHPARERPHKRVHHSLQRLLHSEL